MLRHLNQLTIQVGSNVSAGPFDHLFKHFMSRKRRASPIENGRLGLDAVPMTVTRPRRCHESADVQMGYAGITINDQTPPRTAGDKRVGNVARHR